MSLNPPSFRYPFKLPDDTPDAIRKALETTYDGLVVHEQAFTAIKAQLNTAVTTAQRTASSGGASSSGVKSFNTHVGNVTFFPQLGMVNDQRGQPAYLTQTTDNGANIIVGDSSPVAVTLNAGVAVPWFTVIDNDSSSAVTLIPSSGTVHGANVIPDDGFGIVFFDGTDFWCGATGGSPHTIAPVSGEFLTGYDASTGLFTQAAGGGISNTHSESLTDGNANFIFDATLTSGGDIITVVGVPN